MAHGDDHRSTVINPVVPKWTGPKKPNPDEPDKTGGDGTGGNLSMIGERLARLEEAVAGLRHSHDLLLGVMAIGFGIVVTISIAIGTYTLMRIDTLPDEFQRMNVTLSSAITAARQQPQQVIILPAPATVQPVAPAKTH